MTLLERLADPVPAYLNDLLDHVPATCDASIDVGCGAGSLTRRLAQMSRRAVGIDRSAQMIELARQRSRDSGNVEFRCEDFVDAALPHDHFDYVIAVASIHHMDFERALAKMRDVAKPAGVVAVLGLARDRSIADYVASAAGAFQVHTVAWPRRRKWRNVDGMPLRDATMTYRQVRDIAADVLPGVRYRRHPAFRYSLLWRKPGEDSG